MTYKETIKYLFTSTPLFQNVGGKAYKEGLSNTHLLDTHFQHPHTQYKTIHVAGTNGKGSCAHTLAAILQLSGLKVGLYTSPHLIDFRERIRINGKMISKEYVINFVEKEKSFFEPLHPSFFEITTALAFKYFADKQVDVAIIEVGLGGRLDCTNIISPIASIITNISLDHTQFLGHTLTEIAHEKAGIIKPLTPVIIGESTPETRAVFHKEAQERQAPIIFAEDNNEILSNELIDDKYRIYFTKNFGTIKGDLLGDYQIKNTNTILNAIPCISSTFNIQKPIIQKAFNQVCNLTGLQGRWQTICQQPLTICDAGHNQGGWNYLGKRLQDISVKNHQLHIVFGVAADKEIDQIMNLLPQKATYYWTQASVQRALPADKVKSYGKLHHLDGDDFDNVAAAYLTAKRKAKPDDIIFIGGSCFVVADLLNFIKDNQNYFVL